MPTDPHSSPVETTEGSARPIPPTDAIETDWCAHTTLARHYRDQRDEALAEVERLKAEVANWRERQALRAENARLIAAGALEQLVIRNAVDQLREVLVERDKLRAENYRLTIAVQDASTKHKILREFDSPR